MTSFGAERSWRKGKEKNGGWDQTSDIAAPNGRMLGNAGTVHPLCFEYSIVPVSVTFSINLGAENSD